VVSFDTDSGKIDIVAHLPAARAFGDAAKIGGAIYYIGGSDGTEVLDEILEYTVGNGRFRRVGALPSPRELLCVVSANDFLYAIGGSDDKGQYLDEILEIDTSSGKIPRIAHLPYEIKRSAASVWQGEIIIAGGWEGGKSERVTSVDPLSLSVTSLPDLPRGFSDMALVVYNNECYLIGDFNPQFKRQIGFLRFDPLAGTSEDIKFRSFLFW